MVNLSKILKKHPLYSRLFITILIFSTLLSCKRRGCLDTEAINYDIKANNHDYSCIYNSEGLIFWNENSQSSLEYLEVTNLTMVFNNDTVQRNMDVNTFLPVNDVDCFSSNWYHFNQINYSNKFDVGVMLLNQDFDTIFAGFVTLLPNCNSYRIRITI